MSLVAVYNQLDLGLDIPVKILSEPERVNILHEKYLDLLFIQNEKNFYDILEQLNETINQQRQDKK